MKVEKHKKKSTNKIRRLLHNILEALKIVFEILKVLKAIFELFQGKLNLKMFRQEYFQVKYI